MHEKKYETQVCGQQNPRPIQRHVLDSGTGTEGPVLAPGEDRRAFALVNLLVFLFIGNVFVFFQILLYEMKALVICFRILSGKGLGSHLGTPELAKASSMLHRSGRGRVDTQSLPGR